VAQLPVRGKKGEHKWPKAFTNVGMRGKKKFCHNLKTEGGELLVRGRETASKLGGGGVPSDLPGKKKRGFFTCLK